MKERDYQEEFKNLLKMTWFEKKKMKLWIRYIKIKYYFSVQLFCKHDYVRPYYASAGKLECHKCGKIKR